MKIYFAGNSFDNKEEQKMFYDNDKLKINRLYSFVFIKRYLKFLKGMEK